MSFNIREWCPLHRQSVAALAAELADLRKFVSANVLNGDEASRVLAKIAKADEKFGAVQASGESLILAFEDDVKSGCGDGSGMVSADEATESQQTIEDVSQKELSDSGMSPAAVESCPEESSSTPGNSSPAGNSETV